MTVNDCGSELARPGDELFEELVNLLDKAKEGFEWLCVCVCVFGI